MRILLTMALVVSFSGEALAREVDWTRELLFDGALAVTTIGINAAAPESRGVDRGEFPTQDLDDVMHRQLHGPKSGPTPNARERRFRSVSDGAVAAAVMIPAGFALLEESRSEMAAKALSFAHAMLLENFVVTAIKCTVRRPRPKPNANLEVPATKDDTRSFPSGHSSAAFAGATLFARLFPETSLLAKLGMFGLAGFTALARIEGDKHFFVDTAVGGLIGAGTALAVTAWHRGAGEKPVALIVERNAIGVRISLR